MTAIVNRAEESEEVGKKENTERNNGGLVQDTVQLQSQPLCVRLTRSPLFFPTVFCSAALVPHSLAPLPPILVLDHRGYFC